jgi:hypothetical protein
MINVDTCNALTRREATQRRGWRRAAGAAAMVATLTGCSSLSSLTGGDPAPPPAPAPAASTPPAPAPAPAPSNTSFTSRVKTFFAGDSANLFTPAPKSTPKSPDIDCPGVEIRQGAGTMPVNAPGNENAALSLRYQASFVQTARECIVRGPDLVIKVGVQGRIVVGPAGGPGQITIPLRYALVREGVEPQTLWTKLFLVPVTIPQGQLNLPWLHIEEEMTVPLPPGREVEAYMIYIGFDPDGATPPKPAAKPKPRAR